MRGKVEFIKWSGTGTGITPAYAGKSTIQKDVTEVVGDHPRICGEKQVYGQGGE